MATDPAHDRQSLLLHRHCGQFCSGLRKPVFCEFACACAQRCGVALPTASFVRTSPSLSVATGPWSFRPL
eukprot:6477776-Amphidinium_carterae.3